MLASLLRPWIRSSPRLATSCLSYATIRYAPIPLSCPPPFVHALASSLFISLLAFTLVRSMCPSSSLDARQIC